MPYVFCSGAATIVVGMMWFHKNFVKSLNSTHPGWPKFLTEFTKAARQVFFFASNFKRGARSFSHESPQIMWIYSSWEFVWRWNVALWSSRFKMHTCVTMAGTLGGWLTGSTVMHIASNIKSLFKNMFQGSSEPDDIRALANFFWQLFTIQMCPFWSMTICDNSIQYDILIWPFV